MANNEQDIQDAIDEFAKLAGLSERVAQQRLQGVKQKNGKVLVSDTKGELGSAVYDPGVGMFD